MTERRSSWWGNYSLHPRRASSLFACWGLHLLPCLSPTVNLIISWEKLPFVPIEAGLFFSAAWWSRSFSKLPIHTWQIFSLHLITTASNIAGDCKDNHVSSSAAYFSELSSGDTLHRGVLRSKPLMWDQTVFTSVCFRCVCVCVCAGREGRCGARRIIRQPLITHRWLISGLRVWRCPSIRHFLLYTHVRTQTQFLAREFSSRWYAGSLLWYWHLVWLFPHHPYRENLFVRQQGDIYIDRPTITTVQEVRVNINKSITNVKKSTSYLGCLSWERSLTHFNTPWGNACLVFFPS